MTLCILLGRLRRILLPTVFVALSFVMPGAPAQADELINQSLNGVAILGYDPVAYFTDNKAVKGSNDFTYEWLGATWHFASAEHRDLFMADPVKYAPQYGGYCAQGMLDGSTAGADPNSWRIVDGKLYMYGSQDDIAAWTPNETRNISTADVQWGLLKANLSQ